MISNGVVGMSSAGVSNLIRTEYRELPFRTAVEGKSKRSFVKVRTTVPQLRSAERETCHRENEPGELLCTSWGVSVERATVRSCLR